ANPSIAMYYRAQQEQSGTPSTLTNGSEASGCSRGSLSVSQNFISTVNTSLVSAMNNMLNNKKSSIHGHQDIPTAGKSQGESSNLRDAFLPETKDRRLFLLNLLSNRFQLQGNVTTRAIFHVVRRRLLCGKCRSIMTSEYRSIYDLWFISNII
ncbi:hypothetical protein Tcan_07454, partial [Toxocara canis]